MGDGQSRAAHSVLMDKVYRRQRHFYDLTRKYYLLGRDRLVRQLNAKPGERVIEIGCGTGALTATVHGTETEPELTSALFPTVAGWLFCACVDTRWARPIAPSSAHAASTLL